MSFWPLSPNNPAPYQSRSPPSQASIQIGALEPQTIFFALYIYLSTQTVLSAIVELQHPSLPLQDAYLTSLICT